MCEATGRWLDEWGGEVLIHHRLRLCSVAGAECLAQGLDVGQVFFGPTRHELAGQDIPQVAWDIQAQLLVSRQLDPMPEGQGLASGLHRNSAYRKRRAGLASLSDPSGHTDKIP